MQDIFVTTLHHPIDSWRDAFKACYLSLDVPTALPDPSAQTIFWLHMNEDRQHWMQGAVKRIVGDYSDAKIVVLANVPDQAEALFALSLGAMGYAHAYASAETLREIKTVIEHGGVWMGNELLQKLIQVSTSLVNNQPDQVESILAKLTKREQQVAAEAAKGLSNKEIARILSITERTVKAHLASIFTNLKVKDRLQLALMLNKNVKI